MRKLSIFGSHLSDYSNVISEGLHETNAVDDGIMIEETKNINNIEELIFNGVHLYVSTPFYQNPQKICKKSSQYDTIFLPCVKSDFLPRTNFSPKQKGNSYESYIKGFVVGQDIEGNDMYDNWISYYKVGLRKMLDPGMERTLICSLLPPMSSHTNGVISAIFKNNETAVELTGLLSSLTMDFFMKTAASQNMTSGRFSTLPLGISNIFTTSLFVRTLLLNCLTKHYADLWQKMWKDEYKQETWSIEDNRLKPFALLTDQWQWATPLRNYFERRQALVEIDVIATMALGLSLQDLEMIYTIQFPVLQQNENDTWYDAEGKIVFTCSKGLTGVGLDRKRNNKTGMLGWEDIRGEQIDENTYAGTSPTHTHTIAPAKSELYGGQQQTFVAPYTRCDRIADYRTAWAHFEKIFNE